MVRRLNTNGVKPQHQMSGVQTPYYLSPVSYAHNPTFLQDS